jgi:hypothetical protein
MAVYVDLFADGAEGLTRSEALALLVERVRSVTAGGLPERSGPSAFSDAVAESGPKERVCTLCTPFVSDPAPDSRPVAHSSFPATMTAFLR